MMNKWLVASSAFFVSSSLSAAPVVTGNTISWPNDGWYQVQDAGTYANICGGTSFCEVESGVYNVINHSTGERFENIAVNLSLDVSNGITVEGNTISWPNNGWYQVQRSDNYETICGGGQSCVVPNGLFIVINHSTGERFENIEVSGGAGLNSFDSGEAFYSALRQALIQSGSGNRFSSGEVFLAVDSVADADGLTQVRPEAAPAESQANQSLSAGGEAGNDVTTTNVQELGVDEQDRVKVNAAGTQLFVLNTEFINAFPIDFIDEPEIAIEEELFESGEEFIDDIGEPELASEPEEPTVVEVGVTPPPPDVDIPDVDIIDEEEPLFTSISRPAFEERKTTLTIFGLDAETPDTTGLAEFDINLKGRNADGFYLYEKDGQSSAIVTATGGGFWGFWGQSQEFAGRESVITKLDVTDASNVSESGTFTIDGQIVSSRRIGDNLFFVSRYYPSIPGVQGWQQNEEKWREAVETANLAELMPVYTSNSSNETTPLVNASSCFVATGVADSPYYTPDIITMGVIDLGTMELKDSECYLGSTETLYASTESVFLATTKYEYSSRPAVLVDNSEELSEISFPPDVEWFDPRTTTDIHQFDINSDGLSYAGSGSVRGHLGWNTDQKPYRMSESNGYLRVATMNDQQGPSHSPILLSVLKADGRGNLETVGSLPNDSRPEFIGKPGERLYASRFLGDRGYLVTFRQTDPLYVVNLEDPNDPIVEGELEIQGYSDYLTPVGENHLLGIGKDAVAAIDGFGDGRGALVQGIKLSLFDVSDPAAPTEVQSVLLGQRGTESEALSNPRAITIQAANENHPMRVSFGASVSGTAFPTSSPTPEMAFDYPRWSYTGLHGFDVTGGANASITSRGALIVDTNDGGERWYGRNSWSDRSVMVNDAVFYVNGNDVYSALWDNLANPTPR